MATFKSSHLRLYSADNLSEEGFHLTAVDAQSSITSPNPLALDGTQVDFHCGGSSKFTITPSKVDFANYLETMTFSGGTKFDLGVENSTLSLSGGIVYGTNTRHSIKVQGTEVLGVTSGTVSVTGDVTASGHAPCKFNQSIAVSENDTPAGATTQAAFELSVDGSGLRVGNTTQSGSGIANPSLLYSETANAWEVSPGWTAPSADVGSGGLVATDVTSASGEDLLLKRNGATQVTFDASGITMGQLQTTMGGEQVRCENSGGVQAYNGREYHVGDYVSTTFSRLNGTYSQDDAFCVMYASNDGQAGYIFQSNRTTDHSTRSCNVVLKNFDEGNRYHQSEFRARSSGTSAVDGKLELRGQGNSDPRTAQTSLVWDESQNAEVVSGDMNVGGTLILSSSSVINHASGVSLAYGGTARISSASAGVTVPSGQVLDAATLNFATGVNVQYGGFTKLSAASDGVIVSGTLTTTSDERKKVNVERVRDEDAYAWVRDVPIPVQYKFIGQEGGRLHRGLIAQDVEDSPFEDVDLVCKSVAGLRSVKYADIRRLVHAALREYMKREKIVNTK